MVDQPRLKLGRKAIKTDTRTLMLANYLTPSLPAPPPAADWTRGIASWGMMLNDKLGDCTIAGIGHAVQVWSANSCQEITVPDDAILASYEQWDGYNPADPSTDQGGIELDVLTDFKANGLAGHKLLAFADAKAANLVEVRQSIALFGGVYIGVSLPLTAQSQDMWDVVPDDGSGSSTAGSWGGHEVFLHHLGRAEKDDHRLLEGVRGRGARPALARLAHRQGIAQRIRPPAASARSLCYQVERIPCVP
jgi:hypothetical protein